MMRPYWLARVLMPEAPGAVTVCTCDCARPAAASTGAGVRLSTGVSSSFTLEPHADSRPAISAAVPRVKTERAFIWRYLLVVVGDQASREEDRGASRRGDSAAGCDAERGVGLRAHRGYGP